MVKICISEYEVPERGFDVSRCPVVRASHTPLHRYNLSLWTIEATISNMNVIRRYKRAPRYGDTKQLYTVRDIKIEG
ncbi:uncharacterized protein LOC122571611 isoform X2 [Bombus pyrosoma]|uniref:uncharacterized protein LOC122571611 isoform X2 n=1 Tax=Bombus pyrosoma TaxID=396416 RepID=UPI001CB980DC|nr:uncharacterized protein LOC122571611 isoform X2 [Bombus pyrosoma]